MNEKMEDNIGNAMNKIQEMLSSEDGRKNLQDIMGSLAGNIAAPAETQTEEAEAVSAPAVSPDILSVAQTFMNGINSDSSPRSRLLTALKPYLSKSRHNHIDNAIKIMSLGNIPEIMKNFRK